MHSAITFRVESFTKARPELRPLLLLHHREISIDQDKVALDPMWEVYEEYERRDDLLFVAAREDGQIVGYAIGFVNPALHYRGCLTCVMDIFYVRRDKRVAMTGVRMFRFVEHELRRRGVKRWLMGCNAKADTGPIFKRIGAEEFETYYTKWLGE